jgi:polyketide cyclase/dehydrase/lipid transport protein
VTVAVDVVTQIVVDRPRGEVSAYTADPLNAPSWQTNIKAAELKTPPPVRVGSRVEFHARFLGRSLVYTYDFTEFVPGERLVMQTPEGQTRWVTTYTWESIKNGKGTRMTVRNWGEPGVFASVAKPLLERSMRGATSKSLTRLKATLERAST